MTILSTLLGWLPLGVPVGILVVVFLVFRKLNRGNITAHGPAAQPHSLEPWNAPPSHPYDTYDRPPVHIQPPMDLRR